MCMERIQEKKYDIIRENPNVFIEIDTDMELISGDGVPCEYGASYASVMGEGVASILEDVEEKETGIKDSYENADRTGF